MDLSIAIPSYNTKDFLQRCLGSIFKNIKKIKFEVIVVDNGSTDGTKSLVENEFPQVTLISNRKNNYFSKANNQAFKRSKGKYFLILNSDTYFVDDSIKKMIGFMEKHNDVGACEGLEFYEDRSIVPTGSKDSKPLTDFFELSIIGKKLKIQKLVDDFRLKNRDRRKNFEIDVGCGAFFMVRSKIFKKIKGFDEDLKLYYTDNDLCMRIKKLNYKIFHLGDSKIIHTASVTANKLKWEKLKIYYNDLLYFYRKNGYSSSGYLLFVLLNFELIILRIFRPKMFN